jgi:hypothetical protein
MPKAKSTQVITHRIELQTTERDTLQAALAGKFVTNTVSATGDLFRGIGAAIAPFSGAITALAVLWIADRSIEDVIDAARTAGERRKQELEEGFHDDGILLLQRVSAWLAAKYAEGGWDAICPPTQTGKEDLALELAAMSGMFAGLGWAINPQNPNALLDPHGHNFPSNPLGDVVAPEWFISNVLSVFLNTVCDPNNVMARTNDPVDLWSEFYTVTQYGQDRYYHGQQTYPGPIKWFFGW